MARSKKNKEKEHQKLFYLFYTQERWNNWIQALSESSFDEMPDSEEMPAGLRQLQNFTDDINSAVLKIPKLKDNGVFTAEEALERLNEVEEIIMGPAPEGDISEIIEGIQLRFLALFLSIKKYLKGEYSGDIKTLIAEGRKSADSDVERALDIAGTIGALVLDGGSCCGKYLRGDLEEPGIFDDWLIEIDDMATVLKTLKKFDEEPGETN
ncbi:MAG: hypothetical protein APR53_03240 [Methanoculleus sp. SDB]|nr:MAG: hypothetical protein APR53_03240 [Methanoculleus sp. SDB]